jgi:hypothetical protein
MKVTSTGNSFCKKILRAREWRSEMWSILPSYMDTCFKLNASLDSIHCDMQGQIFYLKICSLDLKHSIHIQQSLEPHIEKHFRSLFLDFGCMCLVLLILS